MVEKQMRRESIVNDIRSKQSRLASQEHILKSAPKLSHKKVPFYLKEDFPDQEMFKTKKYLRKSMMSTAAQPPAETYNLRFTNDF